MELTLEAYLIVLPLAFLAAIVDSIGGGGGLISLPAYSLAGLPYGIASGSNKLSASCGSLAATVRFIRSGKVLWKPMICAVITTIPGSWLGTWLSNQFSNEFMNMFMIFAIPVVAALVLVKKNNRSESKPMTPVRLLFCSITGFFTGFYDGFFGPGTGTFLIFLFSTFAGMDMVTASATAKPVNLLSNFTSLVTRIASGQVFYALAVPAICFSIAGGWIGSKLVLTRGAKIIRYIMLGVMGLLVIKLLVEML